MAGWQWNGPPFPKTLGRSPEHQRCSIPSTPRPECDCWLPATYSGVEAAGGPVTETGQRHPETEARDGHRASLDHQQPADAPPRRRVGPVWNEAPNSRVASPDAVTHTASSYAWVRAKPTRPPTLQAGALFSSRNVCPAVICSHTNSKKSPANLQIASALAPSVSSRQRLCIYHRPLRQPRSQTWWISYV